MDFDPGQSEAQRGRLIAERLRRPDVQEVRIRAAFGSFAIPVGPGEPVTADEHGLGEESAAMVSLLNQCEITVKALLHPRSYEDGHGFAPWRSYAVGLLRALQNPAWRKLDAVYDPEPTDTNLIIFGQSEAWVGLRSSRSRRYKWTLRSQGPDVQGLTADFDTAFERSLNSIDRASSRGVNGVSSRGQRLLDARADLVELLRDLLVDG